VGVSRLCVEIDDKITAFLSRPLVRERLESIRCCRNLCWNLFGAVSGRIRITAQAARSIGVSASLWLSVCHPSTLRMVI
jgi:hypothetical protein